MPLKKVTDTGPPRGLCSGVDLGEVPAGGSPDQTNIVTASSSGNWRPRRGAALLVDEDLLAAGLYDPDEDYTTDDFIFAWGTTWQCNEAFAASSVMGEWDDETSFDVGEIVWALDDSSLGALTWKCTVKQDANPGTTFSENADHWTCLWDERPCMGLHAGGVVGADPDDPSVLAQLVSSDGETILAARRRLRGLYGHPLGYVPPPSSPSLPDGSMDPEWAFMAAFVDTGTTNCRLIRVDINPYSATAGTVEMVETGAGIEHRPWLCKAADNRLVWLLWYSEGSIDKKPSTLWAHFGTWDGTTLDDNSFPPRLGGGSDVDDGVHENKWETGDVTFALCMLSTAEVLLLGDNSVDASSPEPNPPGGERDSTDIAWRYSTSSFPDYLPVSDGQRADLRPWKGDYRHENSRKHINRGYPQLVALPRGAALLCVTGCEDDDHGINVRKIVWSGSIPAVATGTSRDFATSDMPEHGRNAWATGKICLVTRDRYAVAQGTEGASICAVNGGEPVAVPLPSGADITAVCGNSRLALLCLADSGGGETTIRIFDAENLQAEATVYDSSTYPSLDSPFRGMFFDVAERALWVMTYDSGSSPSGNVVCAIYLGIDDWSAAADYETGDEAIDGTVQNRPLYRCLSGHAAGAHANLAAAVVAGDWEMVNSPDGAVFSIDFTGITDLEPECWACLESAGSSLRNFVLGVSQ